MIHWKRWLAGCIVSILALACILLLLSYFFSDFLVDIWWFGSLGYEAYFWQRTLYRYAVFGSVSLFFFLIFFLNFWVASRFLGATVPGKTGTDASLRSYRHLLGDSGPARCGSTRASRSSFPSWSPYLLIGGVFSALYFFSQCGGGRPRIREGHRLLSFSYPIYTLIQRRLLMAFGVLLASVALLYLIERRILGRQEKRLPTGARIHLGVPRLWRCC